MSPITPLSTKTDTFSSITPLNTKTHSFSSTSTSPECSPTTSSSPSGDGHAPRFFDKTIHKVKAFVPHPQGKKTYPQPPTEFVPQQYPRPRSAGSIRGEQRHPAAITYGRHANEWLFGGVSLRKTVSGFFQHDN